MALPPWKARKEALAIVLYCLGATALFFRGPLFLPVHYHIPFDLQEFHHPLSELIAWSLREFGYLPWWNPYSYMGEPFYANVQAAMFYPPTLLTVLIGNAVYGRVTYWLMELQLIAHVVLAGVGAYALLRMLGTTARAALAGATIYHLGAFFASQTQHLGAVSAAAWLPWFLAALYRLEQRRDWGTAALSGVALALMIFPGFPPAYLPALVFAPLLYAFWMCQRHPRPEKLYDAWRAHRRAIVLLAGAVLLALLLSAVSWVPSYHLSKRSVATGRPYSQSVDGLWPEAATSFVWPNLFNQLRGDYWLKENTTFLHLYQGVPALLLVLGGLVWLAHSPLARPFLVAAAVALLWMFGQTFFVAQLVYLLFPRFARGGIYPQYVMAYFSLFFAVLAALALDGYERGERRALVRPRFCWRAASLAAVVALLLSVVGVSSPPESPLGARAAPSGTTLLLVAVSLALCGLLLRSHGAAGAPARARLSAALSAVILFDLLAIGSHTRLNTDYEDGDTPPHAVGFLRERLGPLPLYRIDTSDIGAAWQSKVPQWRLPSANGLNPLLLRDTVVYRAPFSSMDYHDFRLELPESPLLDLAGIRYIVSSRDKVPGSYLIYQSGLNIFENPRALPRFFLVGAVVGSQDVGDAVRMIHTREVDATRVAVVPAAAVGRFAGLSGPATSTEIGEVRLLAYSPNEIRLRVRASRPAVLVATETYWPDWRATVDGAPEPMVRADGVFRAIRVPAGTHEVRMFIVPQQLYLGAALSGVGLLLAASFLLWPAAWRRQAALSPAAVRGQL